MQLRFLLLLSVLAFNSVAHAESGKDSLLFLLDSELEKDSSFVIKKNERIAVCREKIIIYRQEDDSLYKYLDLVFEEYKSFNYDSAFNTILELKKTALKTGDPGRMAMSAIKLGYIFLSSGMFKEASDSLAELDAATLPAGVRQEYYSVMVLLYYSMADQQDRFYGPVYEQTGDLYVDSVLMYAQPGTYPYHYYRGLRSVRSGLYHEGLGDLEKLMKREDLSLHQKAIIFSTLSDVYINLGDRERAVELLAEASLSDIRAATRETAAMLNLANILYSSGDIRRAYNYTRRALEDANFYGARHRKIQVGSILPIIEEEKINTVENQKRSLLIYSVVATILTLAIIVFIVIVMRQFRKLQVADREIKEKNEALLVANQKMTEANRIKEEYIGYYFTVNSNYIDKMDNLKKAIEKNLQANKFDNVRYLINHLDIKRDRTTLYQGFDRVFLKLFPDFVAKFNELFEEKDRIVLSDNELLNTDLRIFALIRIGITENDQIARILDFSVNTVYTYKTRIKNRSLVPNEEFEKRIMEIRFT